LDTACHWRVGVRVLMIGPGAEVVPGEREVGGFGGGVVVPVSSTVTVKLWVSKSSPSDAFTVTPKLPVAVGVQVISPVEELIVIPLGLDVRE